MLQSSIRQLGHAALLVPPTISRFFGLREFLWKASSSVTARSYSGSSERSYFNSERFLQPSGTSLFTSPNAQRKIHYSSTLYSLLHRMHMKGVPEHRKQSWDNKPIKGHNFLKGTVLKVVVRHPKKPNSGNRKCAIVKLSNGIETTAYIPNESHNLQEHSQVLVRGGRRRDLIGVKSVVIRGKLDCAPHKNPKKQYGVKHAGRR